jgi:hypothetical protein
VHLQRRAVARVACSALLAPVFAASTGCGALWRPSPITMNVLYDPCTCDTRADVLLVLLPGAHMALEELQREGFVQAVRQRGLAADMMLVDSHLGYVYDGSLFERLHHDIVAPALQRGWRRIWLAGISLGGYAALGYALRHPGLLEGVFTIAPYLGRQQLVQSISAARLQGLSLQQWLQASAPRNETDIDHALWRWLIDRPAEPSGHPLPLYLGYGLQDRFAVGHALMAQTLTADRVSTAPGGHYWLPWRALWTQWLDRGLLPARCPA